MIFEDAILYNVIYIFEIPAVHRGYLKIGETTLKNLPPTKENLRQAAEKRIRQYTNTAAIDFNLLHVELAVRDDGTTFKDRDVHRVLKKYKAKFKGSTAREWFKVSLDKAKQAIQAVKRGKKYIAGTQNKKFPFRREQLEAIKLTVKHFKGKGNDFLWNAKMRFGKTSCALQVAKEMNFAKTIIITHRPVVNKNWFDDFNKIFGDTAIYGDNETGLEALLDSGKNFVYFASIQDLRGSQIVNGKFDKNSVVFQTAWDFVIVDEAHEGTQTALGDAVIKNLVKPNSKFLALSGTPFNILNDFGENIFTWDYVAEQRAKLDWNKDEPNPYEDLPQMHIYTYDLGKLFHYLDTDENSFSFHDFFKTDAAGENFLHAKDVQRFLNLLVKPDDNNYPYSTKDFRNIFRHTFWIIPGVKEGRALSNLLSRHEVFRHFKIVNVAGSEGNPSDDLEKVRNAIDNHDYTITLSCGKLTTGVTVPEWTAVFYLAGGQSTSAASYLQTIFRVQSPCSTNGRIKRHCYVFDFAPDRTLKMITDAVAISPSAGKTKDDDRQALEDLLKFCPVIALDGSRMKYRADDLLQQLKRTWIERAVRNGFDDNSLYNDKLWNLDDAAWEKFERLKKIVGSSNKQGDLTVNQQGLTEEKHKKSSSPKRELSPEEAKRKEQKNRRQKAIRTMRDISIRLPLLVYASNFPLDDNFSFDKFTEIDDASWAEFMPAGVDKNLFRDYIEYYDKDIFIGSAKKVRERAKSADDLKPSERVAKIAELFATFKNPDKETVLTPWRVVKLHIDSAFDDNFFAPDKHILDINAKTGLYPLYVTYKIYAARLESLNENSIPLDELRRLWDLTVAENIFVICKTPMAKTITRRTLFGFRECKDNFNAHCFDDLINLLKFKPDKFLERLTNKNFWNKGVGKMFFDAVVGNPPYQNAMANTSDEPVYNYFIESSFKLADKVSLIHPARCLFNAGKTPKDFNKRLLANEHVKIIEYFPKSQDVFQTSDIEGGVVITYYDANKTFGAIGTFIPFKELESIHKKVVVDNENFSPLSEIIYPPESFHFTRKFHEDNPDATKILSEGHADDLTTNIFEKLPDIFLDDKPNDGREYIQIFGLLKMKRAYKWIRRGYVRNDNNLEKYKVIVPKSNGSGSLYEVLNTPLIGLPAIGLPLVGCTQTFITVGAFDSLAEAEACLKYIKTKFARAMLGILKVTQDNKAATWAKVPLQDFTSASEINWELSVAEIDKKLYEKYGLSAAEKAFIEERVRAMD